MDVRARREGRPNLSFRVPPRDLRRIQFPETAAPCGRARGVAGGLIRIRPGSERPRTFPEKLGKQDEERGPLKSGDGRGGLPVPRLIERSTTIGAVQPTEVTRTACRKWSRLFSGSAQTARRSERKREGGREAVPRKWNIPLRGILDKRGAVRRKWWASVRWKLGAHSTTRRGARLRHSRAYGERTSWNLNPDLLSRSVAGWLAADSSDDSLRANCERRPRERERMHRGFATAASETCSDSVRHFVTEITRVCAARNSGNSKLGWNRPRYSSA